ncbi:hypothetical protein [Legionella longbeachae]|uniref:Uncharacterized protein n=1 Tax=Legionella longbeachae serogroup 1 (strain NSW150) TaxID=661367 RepID=D3HT19_LEGLN|nr:hypothetical protein [Legionella longbeachae]VEE02552.1 Uncharacterised protein [Legionella oakridgensis]HBD7398810.1 hypothetical protein [Legionella pneumophila]ARB91181.1 hypothetical protein A6J40_02800 [Legionella longbeachae]ARM32392.1 hypothetical protein B0B39_02115 [Legionella longbeachae]EEZ94806.1 hypothetical protein LLB_3723 [Legionella longbeachae D-4968]
MNGIGVDNHESNLKKSFAIKEENEVNPACVSIGIDELNPTTLFVAKQKKSEHLCLNGIGIDKP